MELSNAQSRALMLLNARGSKEGKLRKAWVRIFDYIMYPTKPEQDSRETEISDRLGRFLDQHGYAYPSDYIRPDYIEHEDGFCDLTRDAIARTQESNDRALST